MYDTDIYASGHERLNVCEMHCFLKQQCVFRQFICCVDHREEMAMLRSVQQQELCSFAHKNATGRQNSSTRPQNSITTGRQHMNNCIFRLCKPHAYPVSRWHGSFLSSTNQLIIANHRASTCITHIQCIFFLHNKLAPSKNVKCTSCNNRTYSSLMNE